MDYKPRKVGEHWELETENGTVLFYRKRDGRYYETGATFGYATLKQITEDFKYHATNP